MCLINVRDEEEAVPVRVRRRISPPPTRVVRRSVIEERRSEIGPLPPSIPAASRVELPAPSRVSVPSRAPSTRRARSAYVEVDEDTSDSSESSVSRVTRRTSKSTKSRRTAPSEYSVHERETRRERGYSRPREDYETYRYVEAPRPRSSYAPRTSRDRRIDDLEVDIKRTREYR